MFLNKDLLEVSEGDWEPLLYAKIYNFNILPTLKPYTHASVIGTVHSVSFCNYIYIIQKRKKRKNILYTPFNIYIFTNIFTDGSKF